MASISIDVEFKCGCGALCDIMSMRDNKTHKDIIRIDCLKCYRVMYMYM